MKVVTLLNEKGGVGKTPLATHIAAGLAIRGHRVALIDADPQGHSTIAMGLPKTPTLFQMLIYPDQMPARQALQRIDPAVLVPEGETVHGQLYVIATDVSARVIPMMTSDTLIVRTALEQFQDLVYVVVFDTAPTPSLFQGAIYMATDAILYPTECAHLSFDGLAESIGRRKQVASLRAESGLDDIKVAGIIPNKVRAKTDAHRHALDLLRQEFGNRLWPPILLSTVWEQAQFAQRVLFNYAPDAPATGEIWQIVDRAEAISP